MDITVYLPDELGKWAKEHDLGLSRLLRDAVEVERKRREAAARTLEGAEAHDVTVEDRDGRCFTARVHGTVIAEDGNVNGQVLVFLGKNRKVYVWDERRGALQEDVDTGALRNWLNDGPYIDAMTALGEDAVIDVGLPG
jgi:post-segregation antitoxin (ccd killing protein)